MNHSILAFVLLLGVVSATEGGNEPTTKTAAERAQPKHAEDGSDDAAGLVQHRKGGLRSMITRKVDRKSGNEFTAKSQGCGHNYHYSSEACDEGRARDACGVSWYSYEWNDECTSEPPTGPTT